MSNLIYNVPPIPSRKGVEVPSLMTDLKDLIQGMDLSKGTKWTRYNVVLKLRKLNPWYPKRTSALVSFQIYSELEDNSREHMHKDPKSLPTYEKMSHYCKELASAFNVLHFGKFCEMMNPQTDITVVFSSDDDDIRNLNFETWFILKTKPTDDSN